MSLVNELLRDLDNRRAAPGEWPLRDALQSVNEEGAARREKIERLRRGSIWFAAVMLVAVMIGLMIGRVVNGDPPSLFATAKPAPEPLTTSVAVTPAVEPAVVVAPVAVPSVPAPQLLDVLPQNDGQRLVLQLLLDSSVAYQRTDESGAVSLLLPGVQLRGEPSQGRVQGAGRSLSWRVEARGTGVQVLLVGLGEQLQVHDRLEPAGDRWLLWLEVPLQAAPLATDAALEEFPAASSASSDEPELPDWSSRQVPAAQADPLPASQPTPSPAAVSTARKGPAEVRISSHQADAMTLARQALIEQNYPSAIAQLELLRQRQPSNSDVARLLAQAYLGDGQPAQLLSWLPAQVQAHPQDSDLRMLLARAQLQTGAMPAAVATLKQNAPSLASDPAYHALLAASYQQTRQWPESAALYQQLVRLRPSQATWQLGLAIALEQIERPSDAAKHYRLALEGQGLDAGSRGFAGERVAALQDLP
ncbi:MAG: tetratricopeptide repeat protein [Pseudomonadaceae bacterium]|nr:tetratricopeptide repeat protein [Pseudomonadaceae bacterium]